MTVYRVVGRKIGPMGHGAVYFAFRLDAERALREHRKKNNISWGEVEEIKVGGPEHLAALLNDAVGYGVL